MMNYKQIEAKIKRAVQNREKTSVSCGNGIVIDITPTKAVYYLRTKVGTGKTRKIRLGDYSELSLSNARKMAAKLMSDIKQKTLCAAPLKPKFKEFAAEWMAFKTPDISKKRIATLNSLMKHLSVLDNLRLDEITPLAVKPAIEKLNISSGAKYRAVQVLKQVLNYAVNCGHIQANTCQHLTEIFRKPKVEGFASVPPSDLKQLFFCRVETASEQVRLILLYITLSCLRLGEAVNLRWSWIDFEANVINVPAEYMKMRRPHNVPITPQIKRVLEAYEHLFPRTGDCVFYHPLSPEMPLPIRHIQEPVRAACKGIATIHGLRKTARTWFAEQNVNFDVAERLLAHEEHNSVVRAYQKYDFLEERRKVLEKWNSFVLKQLPAGYAQILRPAGRAKQLKAA